MANQASLYELLNRWRQGDQAAATAIYHRYERRLIDFADRNINKKLQQRVGPESIALTVLESVLKRLATGEYSVDPNKSLWNLLQVIANNKIRRYAEYHHAGRRDVDKDIHINQTEDSAGGGFSAVIIPHEPTPEETAILADELEKIRSRLKSADFEIFQLTFQGYSYSEIAKQLGCARQTVRYKVKRIEEIIRKFTDDHDSQAKKEWFFTQKHHFSACIIDILNNGGFGGR